MPILVGLVLVWHASLSRAAATCPTVRMGEFQERIYNCKPNVLAALGAYLVLGVANAKVLKGD
jgi:hypothetical protein